MTNYQKSYGLEANRLNSKEETLSTINSYMISIVCSGGFISTIFNSLGIVYGGLLPLLSALSLAVSIICCMILSKFASFSISMKKSALIMYILFWFAISYLRFNHFQYLNYYLIEFLFYGGVIFLLLSIPFSYKKILIGISYASLLILVNPVTILGNLLAVNTVRFGFTMGISYAMLPSIMASAIHFLYYRKDSNLLVRIAYLINFVLLILLILHGTRGVFLAFLAFGYAVFFSGNSNKSNSLFKNLLGVISLMVVLVLFFYIEDIILTLYNYMYSIGIEITALEKSVAQMQSRGLLNGRDMLYESAVNIIAQSPLWGSGISYFAYTNFGNYPHNLILHLLVEFGLIFAMPFIILLLISFKVILVPLVKEEKYNEYKTFIMFCFISSIPRLMVSSYIWQDQIFWLLMFTITNAKLSNTK